MLLPLLFVCITIQISICAEKGSLESLADKTFNRQQTSEAPQLQEENLDILIGNVFGPSQPQTQVETSQPQPQVTQNTGVNPGNSGGETIGDCTCVPYYLCSTNKTIIEDGEGLIDIRLRGPCDNYLDVCCSASTNSPDQPFTPKPIPRTSTCGQRNFEGVGFRITGDVDNESQYGEFPWMVAILRSEPVEDGTTLNVYQCGGSLIHPQVILTAAHCVNGKDVKQLKARAGEWDTQTKNELYPHQDRNIQNVVVHENYYAGALYNDVALLILDSPFELADNIALICLPDQGEIMDNRKCVASGWGKDVFGKEGRYQVILKKVELPIVPRNPCVEALRKTRLGQHFKLHDSFICAGGEPGRDTCKGDGGSPLVCPTQDNPNVYRQAGIVAWGIDCGKATPGVYVNVPLFRNWIDLNLKNLNFKN